MNGLKNPGFSQSLLKYEQENKVVAFLVIIIRQNQDIYEVKDEKCEKKKGKRDTFGAKVIFFGLCSDQ